MRHFTVQKDLKQQCAKAGIGFVGLLPNDIGVIQTLSDYAQHLLGRKAAALAALQATNAQSQLAALLARPPFKAFSCYHV